MTTPSCSQPHQLPSSTTGHCACKRTRFTLDLTNLSSDLRLSAYCHCSKCQRLNGAPFIWTTHWAESAVRWSSVTDQSSEGAGKGEETGARLVPLNDRGHASETGGSGGINVPDPSFPSSMAIYETMANRKWKLRCDHCGNPLGSWNQAKRQWSIWPSTLSRDYDDASHSPEGSLNPAVMAAIAPDHHQFYGPWKIMDIHDGLQKFTGYRGQSEQVG